MGKCLNVYYIVYIRVCNRRLWDCMGLQHPFYVALDCRILQGYLSLHGFKKFPIELSVIMRFPV